MTATVASGTPKYWTVQQWAKHFSQSVPGIHKAIKAQKIKAIQLPSAGEARKQVRIPVSEVKRVEKQLNARPKPKRASRSTKATQAQT